MTRTTSIVCALLVGALSLACAQDSRPTSKPAKKKAGLPALGAPAAPN